VSKSTPPACTWNCLHLVQLKLRAAGSSRLPVRRGRKPIRRTMLSRQSNIVPVGPDAGEEFEWFLDPVLTDVFAQHEVVAAASRHKDDCRHVVETLNPLAALVSLASHVEHADIKHKHSLLALHCSWTASKHYCSTFAPIQHMSTILSAVG